MVTSTGRIVFGGGKVVKNAAGFDIPKFNVGALGRFGVLVELTFKVFPRPESWTTISARYANMADAVAALNRVAVAPCEAMCLDLTDDSRLLIRLGGIPSAQPARVARVSELLSGAEVSTIVGPDDDQAWRSAREFSWAPSDNSLLKIPILPDQILKLEDHLNELGGSIPRRYSVGGNVAWVALPSHFEKAKVAALHTTLGRNILALRGNLDAITSNKLGAPFEDRLKAVFG